MSMSGSLVPLRPTRLMRNATTYHQLLRHRFAVPRRLVNPAIRSLKYLLNPSEKALRKRYADSLPAAGATDRTLAEEGYVLFEPGALPGLLEAIDRYRREWTVRIAQAEADAVRDEVNKSMLVTVVPDTDFFDYPELMEFAISPAIVELASRYLGRVPLLTALSLWWSPPNDLLQQSQLYHCDGEDRRQLKFFFNVDEVGMESGPFTLLSAPVSDRVRAARSIVANKVSDDEIEAAGALDRQIVVTGPPGAGACVDTCRCLHFGSRGNTVPRVVIMLRFNDILAPNVDMPDWHLRAHELGRELDDIQKLVLGIRLR